jgi:hypothetical protein
MCSLARGYEWPASALSAVVGESRGGFDRGPLRSAGMPNGLELGWQSDLVAPASCASLAAMAWRLVLTETWSLESRPAIAS